MKTLSLLLAASVLCFSSCNHRNGIEKRLIGSGHRYWDIYGYNEGKIGTYRFDEDGSCYYLMYDKKRVFFYSDDVFGIPNRWKVYNDSIEIWVGAYPFKYTFKGDSIILRREYELEINGVSRIEKIIDTLVLSPDQTDQYNFDSLKKCKGTVYYYKKE